MHVDLKVLKVLNECILWEEERGARLLSNRLCAKQREEQLSACTSFSSSI